MEAKEDIRSSGTVVTSGVSCLTVVLGLELGSSGRSMS